MKIVVVDGVLKKEVANDPTGNQSDTAGFTQAERWSCANENMGL